VSGIGAMASRKSEKKRWRKAKNINGVTACRAAAAPRA
jgi:hypothetical protein